MLVLTAVVVLALGLSVASRPHRVAEALQALADRVGLPVPAEERAVLLRRVRGMRVGEVVGASAGIVLALPITPLLGTAAPVQAAAFLSLGGLLVLRPVGRLIGGFASRPALLSTGGVGPERVLVVGDYVGPAERGVMWGLGALAAVLGPLPQLLGGTGTLPAVIGVAALVTVLVVEGVARAVVAGPQATTDPVLLVWDDALRSVLLRGLVTAAWVVGVAALVIAVPPLVETASLTGTAATSARSAPIVVLLLVLAAGALRSVLREPSQRYLRRLWPGQLPPGRPEASR